MHGVHLISLGFAPNQSGDETMQSAIDTAMQSAEDMRRQLTAKALVDEDFRRQLLADPKGAIHQEFGLVVPENTEIRVHESTTSEFHLALPANGGDLSEEQLEAIAAGLSCCI